MEKMKGEALHGFFLESLRRTDSYIASADQKASFTLAGGLAFLAIYASLFDKVISFPNDTLGKLSMLSLIGISIIPWVIWFYKIMKVFHPNVSPGHEMSYVSFATMYSQNESKDILLKKLSNERYELEMEGLMRDVVENYWICSEICMNKMASFKSSLKWLSISISFTLLIISIFSFLKSGIV